MSEKNFIALGVTDPQWLEIFKNIFVLTGYSPSYITAMGKREIKFKKVFINSKFHRLSDAVRNIPHPDINWEYTEPSIELINAMHPHVKTILKMFDRIETFDRSINEKERYDVFLQMLSYWTTVLKTEKPNFVFFPISPHASYDYIVYQLCKILGINTILTNRTGLPNRILIQRGYDDNPTSLPVIHKEDAKIYENAKYERLSDDLNEHLEKIRFGSGFDTLPANMQSRLTSMKQSNFEKISRKEKITSIVRYEVGNFLNRMNSRKISNIPDIYFANPNKAINESTTSVFRETITRFHGYSFKNRLRTFYQKICITHEEITGNYIYFPLHYQPERSSLPDAGVFADQVKLAINIAKLLPPDWRLVVKEHPMQWSYFKKGEQGRTLNNYEILNSYKNITFVDIETNSRELIKFSKGLITLTGSAGWEAINLGIPCLIFGSAWYEGAPGSIRVKSYNEIQNALENLVNSKLKKANFSEIDLFVSEIDKRSHFGVVDTIRENTIAHHSKSAANIAQGIIKLAGIEIISDIQEIKRVKKRSLEEIITTKKKPRAILYTERSASANEFQELANRLHKIGEFEVIILASSDSLLKKITEKVDPEINVVSIKNILSLKISNNVGTKKTPRTVLKIVLNYFFPDAKSKIKKKLEFLLEANNFKSFKLTKDLIFLPLSIKKHAITADIICKKLNPDVFIVGDDRTLGFVQGIGKICKKNNIPVALAQYASTTEMGGITMRMGRSIYHINKGILAPLKKLLCKLYPEQIIEYKDTKLMFHSVFTLLGLIIAKSTFRNPWCIGGAFSSKIFLVDEIEENAVKRVTNNIEKYEISGQASFDRIYELFTNKHEQLPNFKKRYNLNKDKKIIIFAVPHFAEHKILTWDEHLKDLNKTFELLSNLPYETILSFHPRAKLDNYLKLVEKYNMKVAFEPLNNVIVFADLFLCTYSSTIKWADAINVPIIINDTNNLNLNYFTELNLLSAKDHNTLSKLIISEIERPAFNNQMKINGKCVEKINNGLKKLIN